MNKIKLFFKEQFKDLTLYLPFFITAMFTFDLILLKSFFQNNLLIFSGLLVFLIYLLLFTFVWKLSLNFKKKSKRVTLSIILALIIPLFVYVINLLIIDFYKNLESIFFYLMFIIIFGWFSINIIRKNKTFSKKVIYTEIAINSSAASITMLAIQAENGTPFISLLKTWQFDFMIIFFILSIWISAKLTSRKK